MKKVFFLALSFIFFSYPLLSQFYVTGQDPASIKWKQIETPHFKLIFPDSFSGKANNYANLLEKSFKNAQLLYPNIKGKLPVIIHNYSMISNGYVSWAPKRIELYPLPGQTNLPDNPSWLLVMHEVTHVGEISSLIKGDTKFLSVLFGEQVVGVASSLLPDWSLEGDAVFSETLFSNSGRGRSTGFMQAEKSICLDQSKMYSYSKMLFGSYNNFTPDQYVYGYLMMDYMRSKYPGFWEKNVDFTGKHSLLILPTNLMLRSKLHINKNCLYHLAVDSAKARWINETREYNAISYKSLVPVRKHDYSSYLSPFITEDGKIIALKSSLSDPDHFVGIDTLNLKEKNLGTVGYVYPSIFSYSMGKIVWSQTMPDKRWDNRNFSVIKIMDVKTGKTREISPFTRYSAPAISHDTSLIAAVNTSLDLSTSLVIIDPVSGKIKDEIQAPSHVFLQRPEWSSDDRSVVVVTLSDEGEGISCYDREKGVWQCLIKPTHTDIEKAELDNGTLFFLMQDKYSVNVYSLSHGGDFRQVTFSRLGISSFSFSENHLIFSDYSKDGFNVSSLSLDSLNVSGKILSENTLFNHITNPLSPDPSDTINYEIKRYSLLAHPFNFHSWAPLYYNADNILSGNVSIAPGFTLFSQNDLSTVISSFGYEHQRGIDLLHTSVTFEGIYPIITAGIRYGNSYLSHLFDNINTIHSRSYYLNVTIPVFYQYNKFRQLFTISAGINYLDDYYSTFDNQINKNNYSVFTPRLYTYNLFQMAPRDIYPRWGQVFSAQKSYVINSKDSYSDLSGFTGILFFPGLFRNNSTMVTVGYETQLPLKKYIFNNLNSFSRGYNGFVSAEMTKVAADYTFPVLYPDLSARSIIYLKRVRGNIFYDWLLSHGTVDQAAGDYNKKAATFSSSGAELLADFYLLRIPYEISSGVRYGYKIESGASFTEFVFSVNIYGSTLGLKR
jgi:hypothetical protein